MWRSPSRYSGAAVSLCYLLCVGHLLVEWTAGRRASLKNIESKINIDDLKKHRISKIIFLMLSISMTITKSFTLPKVKPDFRASYGWPCNVGRSISHNVVLTRRLPSFTESFVQYKSKVFNKVFATISGKCAAGQARYSERRV